MLVCQQQHCHKQCRDHPGTRLYLLNIAAEHADHHVGDQAKRNAGGFFLQEYRKKRGHAGNTLRNFYRYRPLYSCLMISAISSGDSLQPPASHILMIALSPLRKNSTWY